MPQLVPILFPTLIAGSTAAIVAGVGLSIAGSMILGAASRALSPGGREQSVKWGGSQVSARVAASPRSLVYGQTKVGGTIVYMSVSGAHSQYLNLVVAIASCQVEAIDEVYFGDEVAFHANGTANGQWNRPGIPEDDLPDDWFEHGETQLAFIDKRLGSEDQVSFRTTARIPSDWTDDHRLRGATCVFLRLISAPSGFPQGLPEISFMVKGCNQVTDPRTGTTGYSDNPALCLAHYMSHPKFGFGCGIGADDGLNLDSLVEAANICDEEVDKVGGGLEKRYTLNGSVSLSEEPLSNVRSMLTSFAGSLAPAFGQHFIRAGAWREPVAHFDLGHLTGPLEISSRVSMNANFSAVRGKFVGPETRWQLDDFPPVVSSFYQAEDDGELRWADVELPFTTGASEAQRLARIMLEQQRHQITVTLPGNLSTWTAPVGETVTITHPLRGWTEKPFTVTECELKLTSGSGAPLLEPVLKLRETSPLVWDWNASEAQVVAAAPPAYLPSAFSVDPPGITEVRESLYVTRSGDGVKSQVHLAFTSSDASASRYLVSARQGDGPWEKVAETQLLEVTIPDVSMGVWQFRVTAYNSFGVGASSSVAFFQVFGLGAPPAALTGLSLQTAGGAVILQWDLHPDLDVRMGGRVEVRHSASPVPLWENSVHMLEVAGGMATAQAPNLPGTYLLRAVDSSGVKGPVGLLGTAGAEATPFVSAGSLQEDNEFSGTHVNTEVQQGILSLTDPTLVSELPLVSTWPSVRRPTGLVATSGVYEFATQFDFGAVKTVRLRREVQILIEKAGDSVANRPGLVSSWPSVSGAAGGEVDVSVEVSLSTAEPPVWQDWRRLERDEVTARYVRARVVLTALDPSFTPKVEILRIHADEVA